MRMELEYVKIAIILGKRNKLMFLVKNAAGEAIINVQNA